MPGRPAIAYAIFALSCTLFALVGAGGSAEAQLCTGYQAQNTCSSLDPYETDIEAGETVDFVASVIDRTTGAAVACGQFQFMGQRLKSSGVGYDIVFNEYVTIDSSGQASYSHTFPESNTNPILMTGSGFP